jgi:hypothetical protein
MYPYTTTNQHPNSGYPGASLGGPPMGMPMGGGYGMGYPGGPQTTVYTTTTSYPTPSPYMTQPNIYQTTQYARLPGMVTMNPYLSIPSVYNRVFYQWYGPYQDPRMPFQVCFIGGDIEYFI